MMKERFMLADNEMFLRDLKHRKSYSSIDDIITVMNRVNKTDNCAVDIIVRELKKQEDKNVLIVLEKILDEIHNIDACP